jgi:hypothetical protein
MHLLLLYMALNRRLGPAIYNFSLLTTVTICSTENVPVYGTYRYVGNFCFRSKFVKAAIVIVYIKLLKVDFNNYDTF